MQVQTRQGPAYGVARLTLAPNEPVKVEAGAMMAMSAGVTLQSKAEGGIMKSLKRAALGGESFFVSTYTAPPSGGFVDVAARLPGDYVSVYVPTTPNPTSGFFLMMPRADVLELRMSVDEALKYVISMGVVAPVDAPAPARN